MGHRLIVDRTVAVGPVDFLALAETRDWDQRIYVPGRTAAGQYLLDLRTNDLPDFRPDFTAGSSKRTGMSFWSDRLAISVVIEAKELRTPPDVHRMTRIEQQSKRRLEGAGPMLRCAERMVRPVERPYPLTHLAAAV